jgi:hypothetical protein
MIARPVYLKCTPKMPYFPNLNEVEPKAQGCEARATLGKIRKFIPNLE